MSDEPHDGAPRFSPRVRQRQRASPQHPRSRTSPSAVFALPPIPSPPSLPPSSFPSSCPPLLSPSTPSSPHSAHRAADSAVSVPLSLWQCSLGCGRQYEKSSGRSIRRHMTSCFRAYWPGASTLSDSDVQALMSAQQASGHLVTGLKRWRMRQSSRPTLELGEKETWTCPQGCGQTYRVTSTRSIQRHPAACQQRLSMNSTDRSSHDTDTPQRSSAAPSGERGESRQGEEAGVSQSARDVDRSPPVRRLPNELDGFEEDVQLHQGLDDADDSAAPDERRSSSESAGSASRRPPSPRLPSPFLWENTPLRKLLRRQQLEVEQLSAQHYLEVVALRDRSPIAPPRRALSGHLEQQHRLHQDDNRDFHDESDAPFPPDYSHR